MDHAREEARAFDEDAVSDKLSFASLYRPYWFALLQGLVWLVLTNMAAAWIPSLVNRAVNQIVRPAQSERPIWFFAILLVALALAAGVFRTLSRREIFNIGRMIERDTRRHLFDHVILQSRSFFRSMSVGDLMNHSLGDITNIRLTVGFAMLNFFNILIVTMVNVPLLISISPQIALWSMSPFILVIIVAQVFSARMFKGVTLNQEAQSKLSAHVQENLTGAQVVRLFGREAQEGQKFKKVNYEAYVKAMNLAWVRTIVFPLTRAMGGLGVAVVLFVGGTALSRGDITIGDFIEVNTRLLMLSWPAISVGIIISMTVQGRASLERINKILAVAPTMRDGTLSPQIKGDISLENLRVETGERTILGPLSLTVQSPSLIGVVGPSGSGKSTIISCLLRQEERALGTVRFDGVDIKDFRLKALFSQVSSVLPEPFLFGETMRSNICFAKPDACDADLLEVVKLLGLDVDIARMERGFDTLVGEKGVMLSGGQRQRVALARALLAKPQILLLDDCFSAVDAETESQIIESLRHNRFAPTVIFVSHRLSAMRYVDDVWVLDRGLIVEKGTHRELLENGKLYQLLWGVETLSQQVS